MKSNVLRGYSSHIQPSIGTESRCLAFILWIAAAGSGLFGQVIVQFLIVLHLYNRRLSSGNACNRSSEKSSRLKKQNQSQQCAGLAKNDNKISQQGVTISKLRAAIFLKTYAGQCL